MIKAWAFKIMSWYLARQHAIRYQDMEKSQEQTLYQLLKSAQNTDYGQRYGFKHIKTYDAFTEQVPLIHYHDLLPYFERIAAGSANILWPQHPLAFVHSSGSTGGRKHLPIFRSMVKSQHRGRLIAMAYYAHQHKNYDCFTKPMLILSAADAKMQYGQYPSQLLSHILSQQLPKIVKRNTYPHQNINKLYEFNERMAFISNELIKDQANLSGIVGFPPWMLYLLKDIQDKGHTSKQLLRNISVYVSSGMSLKPYEKAIRSALPEQCNILQTYPSSEGFLGFTPASNSYELCLMPKNGIFYEFISLEDYHQNKLQTHRTDSLENNKDYVVVISNNSGLFRYIIGDTIHITNTKPLRFTISGRISNTLGIMGEHLTQSQWDNALYETQQNLNCLFQLSLVSAQNNSAMNTQRYEVILECNNSETDSNTIEKTLHMALKKQNILYETYADEGLIIAPKVQCVGIGELLNKHQQVQAINEQSKWLSICTDYSKFKTIQNAFI